VTVRHSPGLQTGLRSVIPMHSVGNWPSRRLGDLLEAIIDYRGKTPPKAASGIATLTAANVRNGRLDLSNLSYISQDTYEKWTTRGLPEPGDVLITTEAPIGEVASFPCDGKYLITRRLMALRGRHGELDNQFLKYMLMSRPVRQALLSAERGSTVPRILKTDVTNLKVPIPDVTIQRRLAHILGTLDDKIELNRRMNRTLEAIARAIFKSWFVDFDPVIDNAILNGKPIPDEFADRAEARREILAQDIGDEGVAGYRHLFPDRFQDSPLGKIPKGWTIKALDEIAGFINGAACQKYAAEPGEPSLPVVKIRELGQGVTLQSDRARLDIPEKHQADDGDVLFSWSGTLLCKIWTGGPCFVNQHIFKVTSASFPKWFYLLWINRHLEAFRGVAAGKATTMGHIKRTHLSEALVVVPESSLLAEMSNVLAPIVEAATRTELEARELAAWRDALLPQLLSGAILLGDEGEPA